MHKARLIAQSGSDFHVSSFGVNGSSHSLFFQSSISHDATIGIGFAFSEDDLVLETIKEEEEEDDAASRASVKSAKVHTASLAAAAEKEMSELNRLLAKLRLGTATGQERSKIAYLSDTLNARKKEIVRSKSRESKLEANMHRSTTVKRQNLEVQRSLKEKEIMRVSRAVQMAEKVDLAFVVDATNSMKKYIDAVKTSIRHIIAHVRSTNGNLKLRLAIVAYRDVGSRNRFSTLNFVEDVAAFERFVDRIETEYGHDFPEDMAGGLLQANHLSWKHPTRVTYLIADAPCHGSKYHRFNDDYPGGTPGVDIKKQLQQLVSNSGDGTMTLYFGRITDHTDVMVDRFVHKYSIPVEEVPFDDVSEVAYAVTKGVRSSILKTVNVLGGDMQSLSFAPMTLGNEAMSTRIYAQSNRFLKSYNIVPRAPSLSELKLSVAVPVKVYRNVDVASVKDLWAPISFGMLRISRRRKTNATKESIMFVRRAKEPFAEGGIRIAYHGQLARTKTELNQKASAVVLKTYKHHGKGLNDLSQYLKQMEVSTIAHFLAELYNKSAARPPHCAKISFLEVRIVEEEDTTNERKGHRRFCVEAPLPTNAPFTKYSNNTGFWDEDLLDETLLRFTAFTYKITKKYLMVTDLQGVHKDKTFFLTDPAILCDDIVRFGNTNLGPTFMKKCMDSTRTLMAENGWQ